jgi:3-methyladenine DNA glycosylase/8-oxoguanine DNA glycosylase
MKTHNLKLTKEVEYLKKQSSEFKALIDLLGDVEVEIITDHFTALVSQIVFQSISFKAASKIWKRIYDNYQPLTPTSVLNIPFEDLKGQGLTNSKTKYIRNIATAFLHKEINLNFLELSDEEVIKEVTKIKGVGMWTAQMFLIFCLNRPNVIAYGDIAIRKGIEWLYDIDHSLTKEEFEYYRNLFSPYATTASHYLWEITIRSAWKDKDHLE